MFNIQCATINTHLRGFHRRKGLKKKQPGHLNVKPLLWESRCTKKSPPNFGGLTISFKEIAKNLFLFLSSFLLRSSFFLSSHFLEFNVSKNGLTIVKITIILNYPNFFSKKFQTGRKIAYASAAMIETNVLLFFPFLNSTTPSLNANKE